MTAAPFAYDPSLEEYGEALARSQPWDALRRPLVIFAALPLLPLAGVFLHPEQLGFAVRFALIGELVVALLIGGGALYIRARYRSSAQAAYEHSRTHATAMTITDEGITMESDIGSTVNRWGAFTDRFATKDGIVLRMTDGTLLPIPDRLLDEPMRATLSANVAAREDVRAAAR